MNLAVQKLHKYLKDKPGVTQIAFAQIVGITPGYMSMLLDGSRDKPGQQIIFKIRQVVSLTNYDIDLNDWYQPAEPENKED